MKNRQPYQNGVALALFLLSLLAENALSAPAHPLVSANQPFLCQNFEGKSYVVPDQLYSEILNLANVPPFVIADAIDRGVSFRQMIEDEAFPDDNSIKGAAKSLKVVRMKKEQVLMNTTGAENFPGEPANHLRRQGYMIKDGTTALSKYQIPQIFGRDIPVVIECIKPVESSPTTKNINKFINAYLADLRVRATLAELSLSNDEPKEQTPKKRLGTLSSAKLAQFSYTRDSEKNTENFTADGVLGYRVGDFTPFLAYKVLNRDGDDEDVAVLSPGFQYNNLFFDPRPSENEKGRVFFHLRSELFTAFDLENDAQRVAIAATVEPGFSIGTNLLSFGAYTAPFDGPVAIRPSFRPLLEVSHVFDAGTNQQFEDAKDFLGLGSEFGLKVKLPTVPVIDSAVFSIDYRVLRLVAGGDDKYDFLDVSLTWTPKDVPYFGISLSYKSGQNGFTFQEQETFGVGIGARF